ncbi:MAG: hypothetical protein ACKO6J_02250 [Crocinitomicaceae bacterium]
MSKRGWCQLCLLSFVFTILVNASISFATSLDYFNKDLPTKISLRSNKEKQIINENQILLDIEEENISELEEETNFDENTKIGLINFFHFSKTSFAQRKTLKGNFEVYGNGIKRLPKYIEFHNLRI